MDKRSRTATELAEEVRQRIGPGDYKVTIHRAAETGWRAKIHGPERDEIHRCQMMADTVVTELCQFYDLKE